MSVWASLQHISDNFPDIPASIRAAIQTVCVETARYVYHKNVDELWQIQGGYTMIENLFLLELQRYSQFLKNLTTTEN